MSNIINRKANVLVKSGGVTGLSTVCAFQQFDGSFHGSDVRRSMKIRDENITFKIWII